MSPKIIFLLTISLILFACAPAPMQTSEVLETAEVLTFPAPVTAEVTVASVPSSTPASGAATPTEGAGVLDFASLEVGVQHDLTALELKGLGLSGEGFAVTGQYEGVDINIVMMSANGLLATVDGQKGIRLNPVYPEGQGSPADRLAQAVLAGHWRGYQEDHGAISLAQFVADLKAGKDMSYTLTGANVGENRLGTITVDPSKPIEIVGTVDEHDSNGDSWVHHTPAFGYGYYKTADGGLRLVMRLAGDDERPEGSAYSFMSHMSQALWTLGLNESQQSGPDITALSDADEEGLVPMWMPMWYVDPNGGGDWKWDDMIIIANE